MRAGFAFRLSAKDLEVMSSMVDVPLLVIGRPAAMMIDQDPRLEDRFSCAFYRLLDAHRL